MLQPDSATPVLCDTEQVIILLSLPLAGGNRNNSEGHSSSPVSYSEGPGMNTSNTTVQPEMTKREECRPAHGKSLSCNAQGGRRRDSPPRAAGRLQAAPLTPYGHPCICSALPARRRERDDLLALNKLLCRKTVIPFLQSYYCLISFLISYTVN